MAVRKQPFRLAGCGAVAAISLAVLCFYHPSSWRWYVAWLVAHVGTPLFLLFTGALTAGLVLTAFSRYRRKPEVLALALAISAALHLLLAATLTFWPLGIADRPQAAEEMRFEVALGLPSPAEDLIAQQMHEERLKPLEREAKRIVTEKTSTADTDAPLDTPSDPELTPLDRLPSALDPVSAASAVARRVEVEDLPAENARAEAVANSERIIKIRQVKTKPDEKTATQTETRTFEATRAEAEPVTMPDPVAPADAPDLPVPDRATRMETPDIKQSQTAKPVADSKPQQAEVALDMVKLDMNATQVSPQTTQEAAAEKGADRKIELTVAAPAVQTAAVSLPAVEAPSIQPDTASAAPQRLPQSLPDMTRREAPADPRLLTATAQADNQAMAAFIDPVMKIDTSTPAGGDERQRVPMPTELLTASRSPALNQPDAPSLQTVQPELSAGRMANDASLAADRMETPDIKQSPTAKPVADSKPQPAEVALDMVKLDMNAAQVSPQTTQEAAAEKRADGKTELTVAAPAVQTAAISLPSVEAPSIKPDTASTAPQRLPQSLPDMTRREAPADPRLLTATARAENQAMATFIDQAMKIEPSAPAVGDERQRVPMPSELRTASRSPSLTHPDAPSLQTVQPTLSVGRMAAADDASLANDRTVPQAQRGTEKPRLLESKMTGAQPHTAMENTASVMMPAALLRDGTTPEALSESSPGTAPRQLTTGRAVAETFPQHISSPLAMPETAIVGSRALQPSADSRTLANDQARVQHQIIPHAAVESVAVAGTGGLLNDTTTAGGLEIRQLQMTAVPSETGMTGTAVRVSAPVAISRAENNEGYAAVSGLTRTQPATQPGQPRPYETASMVSGSPLRGTPARTASPAPGGSDGTERTATAEVRAALTTGLVAGHVQAAEQTAGNDSQAAKASPSRRPAASVSQMTVERAEQSRSAGEAVTATSRPAPVFTDAANRDAGTLVSDSPDARAFTALLRRPADITSPGRARITEDQDTVALPLAAQTVDSAATPDAETAASGPKAADFRTVAKAAWGGADVTSASAAPLRGWKAPPLPARGSGVRLSLEPGVMADVRRVDPGVSGEAGEATRPPVQSRIADDVASSAEAAAKKSIYELRSPEKRRFIEKLGGSPETEEAVEQALIWLASAQSEDGRWDVDGFRGVDLCGGAGDRIDGDVAVTGLSLLAYLGAGYTHISGKHSGTVRKGLEWLIEGQADNGDLRRGGTMYNQAMATAALCESSSLTGDQRLSRAASLAAGFIMSAQTPEAGWRYEPQTDSDTSVLGWQILALKSAEISGVSIPPQHYAWARMWLNQVRKGSGGLYAYKPENGPTPVMTAEGWFCQLFSGEAVSRQGQQESVAYLLENLPEWNRGGRTTAHLYYWYYATLALRLSSAPEFETWNRALKTALLEGRRREGPAAGSWDPDCQLGPRGGRLYSTVMATLCLEVYYRYLPFYRRMTAE